MLNQQILLEHLPEFLALSQVWVTARNQVGRPISLASIIPEHMQLIELGGTGLPSNVPWSHAAGGFEEG